MSRRIPSATIYILLVTGSILLQCEAKKEYTAEGQETTGTETKERNEKFLSIFSVVRFDNEACESTENENEEGTCYTSKQCSELGGKAGSSCALGFGVCCIFTGECGGSTSKNSTYFQNPDYSSSYKTAGQCTFTVEKSDPDICQLHLNFTEFILADPDKSTATDPSTTYGSCVTDQFLATGNPSGGFGPLCGVNTDQHVYLEVPSGNGQTTLTVIIGSDDTIERKWKIKVSQIECKSELRAPSGCMQYYTGITGIIRSFSYKSDGSAAHLQNQMQVICIRPESGFCSVQYDYDPDISDTETRFGIFTDTADMAVAVAACIEDFVLISNGLSSGQTVAADRFCGEALASTGTASAVPVTSTVRPFILTFVSNEKELKAETDNKGFVGFSLQFTQQPCTTTG